MNNTTAMTIAWWVEAKDVKIDLYQVRIDLLIVPAICVVIDAGISADKAMYYSLAVDTKKNLKAEKIIIESILGTLNLFIWWNQRNIAAK